MDPNETLRVLLESANEVVNARADDGDDAPRSNELEVAEAALALDEWLSGGGFLPARWARP